MTPNKIIAYDEEGNRVERDQVPTLTLTTLRRNLAMLLEDPAPSFVMLPAARGGKIIRRVRQREATARWQAAMRERGLKP